MSSGLKVAEHTSKTRNWTSRLAEGRECVAPRRQPRLFQPWGALAVWLLACATPLPEKRGGSDGDPGGADAGIIGPATLRFDPPAAVDAITPITRASSISGKPFPSRGSF